MAEVEIKGIDELIERLDKITDEKQMRLAIGNACSLVERTAKQKAPKEEGELRRSITSKVETMGECCIYSS